MTEKLELYRCEICGNLVEVVLNSFGELVCCGKPMKKLEPSYNDDFVGEKHVPVLLDNKIVVGSVPHPMENEHYIQFIEKLSDDGKCVSRKYLYPSDKPEMNLNNSLNEFWAREYCNIHGLWVNKSLFK